MSMTVQEIASRLGGVVAGDATLEINGLAALSHALPGTMVFAETAEYLARAEMSEASAVLAGTGVKSRKTVVMVPNPRVAFAKALALFHPEPPVVAGIHPTAVIDPSSHVDPSACVGACCIVGAGASIGPRVRLHGNNFVGDGVVIGEESHLFPNVVVYSGSRLGNRVRIHAGTVIGADGFGYVHDKGVHIKVPQVGVVVIEDDVEIGSNASVDRGALENTVIGKGSKIDNLVQIGHNAVVGPGSIIVSQAGIAGSTRLGAFVTVAGQAGLAGHLNIGDRATIVAKSGVMHDVPAGEKWMGSPAQPDRQTKRQMLAMQRLPGLLQRVAALEKAQKQAVKTGEMEPS